MAPHRSVTGMATDPNAHLKVLAGGQPFDRAGFIAAASMHGIVVVHQVHPMFRGVRACDMEEPYAEASSSQAAKILCPDCHDFVAHAIRDRDKICDVLEIPRRFVPLAGVDDPTVPPPAGRRSRAARLLTFWQRRP